MPKGHGNRIVKPRTAAQREQAGDYGTRPENVIAILPSDAGMPDRSWWTEARTREEFDAAVEREARRMRESKHGRQHGNGTT